MSKVPSTAEQTISGRVPISSLPINIGPLPLSVYAASVVVDALAVWSGKLSGDMIGGVSVLMLAGLLLGKLGQTMPVLKQVGGAAILCLFVPAAMVGYGLMPTQVMTSIITTFKTANLQYFFISCLITGSILGMPKKVLIQGYVRLAVPLFVGTVCAVVAGILVGLLFGHSPKDTFFFIVTPILGGGLAEGVLPLSIGYSEILGRPQEDMVAVMVPATLLGNMVAIMGSGLMARIGDRHPSLSGKGVLVKTTDRGIPSHASLDQPVDLALLGAGMVLSCAFFILGSVVGKYLGLPGPVLMIVCAVIVKLTGVLPARMELGAHQISRFMSTNLTFAILTAMGAVLVDWRYLMASLNLGYILICASTVISMIASGFFIGRWINMYPIEAAIVSACHSGLGGTGDVAILGASDRMGLMAFAQIATRVGGAIMIITATLLMKLLH